MIKKILVLFFLSFVHFSVSAQFPVSLGDLRAGDTLTIIYDVGVSSFPPSKTSVSSQLKLSGSNFSTVLSDDPDTGAPLDATVTNALSPNTISFATNTNPSTCLGSDGKVGFTTTLSDGTYDLSFQKNGASATTQSITVSSGAFELAGLTSGSYSNFFVVGQTDAILTAQVLTDPPTPTLTAGLKTNPTTCLGTDGKIAFTSTNLANGTYTLSYEKGGAATSKSVTVSSNAFQLSGLGAGSYANFSVTVNACTGSLATAQVLTDPPTPTLTAGLKTNPTTCLGTDGKIAFTSTNLPNGTYTLSYEKGGAATSKSVTVSSNAFELSGLGAGSYANFSVTVNACTGSLATAQVLTDPPTPTLTAGLKTNPTTCLGTDGKIAFTSTNLANGTYTLSYEKGGAATSKSVTVSSNAFELSGLGAGSYANFSVTVNACTGSLATAQVLTDPPTPTLTAGLKTNPTTCLGSDGKIAFTSTNLPNGTYTLSYEKDGAATSKSVTVSSNAFELSGLGAGSYANFSVTVNACTGSLATAQVLTDPPTPTLTAGLKTNPTTCLGTDGKIAFTSTNLPNGTYTLSYEKGGAATSKSVTVSSNAFELSGLGAGSYANFSVTVNACTGSLATAQVLTDPPTPTLTAGLKTNPTTCLGSDGKIAFTSTNLPNGTYTLSYEKDGAATSKSVTVSSNAFELSGLGAGSYANFSVTVNACTGSLATAQVLTDPPTPTLTAGLKTNPTTCLGTDGKIAFTSTNLPNGTYTLSYEKGGAATSKSVTVSSNAFELSGLGAGSYANFSVTVNACIGSLAAAQVLNDPPTPTLTAGLKTNPTTCLGTDGKIAFTSTNLPNGTYTLSYEKGGAATSKSVTVSSNAFELSSLGAGSYANFSVTVNACTGSLAAAQVLTDPPTPTLTAGLKTNPTTCLGTDGKIAFTSTNLPNGTYTLSYEKGGAATSKSVTVSSNAFELSGLGAGSYSNFSVTVNACTGSLATAQVLTDPPTPTLTAGLKTNPTTCLGSDGKIAFTSTNLANGTYTLNYEKGGAATSKSVTVSSNAFELSGLGAGSYANFSVTVNACTGSLATAQVLTDPPTPTLTAGLKTNPTTCLGTDGKIAFTSTNLPNGTYTLSYEKDGAATSKSVTVSSNAFELSGLGAGSYANFSVTVNACTGSLATAQVLTDPPTPTLTAGLKTNPTTCLGSDGKIAFTSTNLPNGTYTLNYEKGGAATSKSVTVSSNAFELSGLGAGSYANFSVTVNACTGSLATTQVLTDPPTPTLTAGSSSNPTTCLGIDGLINFTTSLANGSYSLSFKKNGIASSKNITVSAGEFVLLGLTKGAYSEFAVTINQCTGMDNSSTITLGDPSFNPTASNTGPYEEGQLAHLNATSGVSYSWSGPAGFFSSLQNPSIPDLNSSKAGVYSVTIQGGNNCIATATTEVLVSCSSQNLNYYLVYGGANPEIISPLVDNLQVQANDTRPMSVIALTACELPEIESVKLQLSGTSNLQYFVDNDMPFNLHENVNVVTGDILIPNHYTFIGTGYDQDNATGNILAGPVAIPFDIVWYGRQINNVMPSTSQICAGGTFTTSALAVEEPTQTFGGSNLFQVFLSNADGSFLGRTLVGSGSNASSISCQLPEYLPSGDNYKIMVVSTEPIVLSAPSSATIKVIGNDLALKSPSDDINNQSIEKFAKRTIKAENKVSGGSGMGSYKAGKFIELNPGFLANSSAVFEAKIDDPCPLP